VHVKLNECKQTVFLGLQNGLFIFIQLLHALSTFSCIAGMVISISINKSKGYYVHFPRYDENGNTWITCTFNFFVHCRYMAILGLHAHLTFSWQPVCMAILVDRYKNISGILPIPDK